MIIDHVLHVHSELSNLYLVKNVIHFSNRETTIIP